MMTRDFDLERVIVAADELAVAIRKAARHELPDWLFHRLAVLQGELASLKPHIESIKQERIEDNEGKE